MQQLIKLPISDVKLIFRDPSLRIFLLMPFLSIFVAVGLLPDLVSEYPVINDYVPYILMAASLQTSTMFGFIYCMVFIDEKEKQVAKVYGVLPVSKTGFTFLRLIFPIILSILFTFALFDWQPFYKLSFINNFFLSFLAGLIAPILALVVSILSKNKIAGMSWYKFINGLVNIPLLAFFVPLAKPLFGVIPSHWLFQGFNDLILNQNFLEPVLIGLFYSALLLALSIHFFCRSHFA